MLSQPGSTADASGTPRETIQIGTATDLHLFAQAANPPATAPPVKKDLQVPQISPLEKRLQDMGSIRGDGSDKFYGMENVSSRTAPEAGGIAKSLTAISRACLVWKHLLLQLHPAMSLLLGPLPGSRHQLPPAHTHGQPRGCARQEPPLSEPECTPRS